MHHVLGVGASRKSPLRHANTALAAAAALLFSSGVAWAQSNVDTDIVTLPVPDFANTNTNTPSPQQNSNADVVTGTATADTSIGVLPFPPLVFVNTFRAAESLATADITIIGTGPGATPPLVVDQRNIQNAAALVTPLVQQNRNSQDISAVAQATSGIIDLTYNLNINDPVNDGISALSRATAAARFNSDVDQANTSTPPQQVNPASPITQTVTQTNNTSQDFDAVAIADADTVAGADVIVTSIGNTIITGANGVNARSEASAVSHIGGTVDQSNTNSLDVLRNSNASLDARQIVNQTNNLDQDIIAVSIAVAGDVDVTRNGTTTASGNGVNAESNAHAAADTGNAANQTNSNNFLANKNNNNSNQTLTQSQPSGQNTFSQTNSSEELSVAGAGAFSGDINVTSVGTTTAGGNGVNAVSHADAAAQTTNSLGQANTNNMSGQTSAVAPSTAFNIDLTQTQIVTQSNAADRTLVAAAVAVAGDVSVSREGNTEADGIGINAVSQAIAQNATINGRATQTNTNSLNGTTVTANSDISQGQTLSQSNEYELLDIAASVAVAGDVNVSNTGKNDADGDGINATSNAYTGPATITNNLTQTNNNPSDDPALPKNNASTTGAGGHITQSQTLVGPGEDAGQTNDSDAILIAATVAVAGDVTVNNTGNTESDDNGINAVSDAIAGPTTINNTLSQTNTNRLNAGTTGGVTGSGVGGSGNAAFISQAQLIEQLNESETLSVATSVAVAGHVTVNNEGDTEAGVGGINAVSSANAGPTTINNSVNQTNTNSLNATTAGPSATIVQRQDASEGPGGVDQTNESEDLSFATSVAVAEDVSVSNDGDTKAESNGINAASSAIAGPSTINNTVIQTNTNSLTAATTTTGAGASIRQTQTANQTNEIEDVNAATSIAVADDVTVDNDGDTKAKLNGINAVSSAVAGATTVHTTLAQTNENPNPDPANLQNSATTVGANAPITQTQTVDQENDIDQFNFATSVAVADDVTVNSAGKTKAGENGINAVSSANAGPATVDSAVTQSNENSLSASTTGNGSFIAQGPLALTITGTATVGQATFPVNGGVSFPGGQSVEQNNSNGQIALATSVADAGPVTVQSTGDIVAGEHGVNATSVARAESGIAESSHTR